MFVNKDNYQLDQTHLSDNIELFIGDKERYRKRKRDRVFNLLGGGVGMFLYLSGDKKEIGIEGERA